MAARIPHLFFISLIMSSMLHLHLFSNEQPGADSAASSDKVFQYREIVVKEKKEQPGTVAILSDEEVKRSTKNDLLGVISENVASFHTGTNRVMGYGISSSNPAKMSIRGMGVSTWGPTTGFPIFVDGIDTAAHIFSHGMPDVLGMRNIERIEVYESPQPVIFGSGAMAGAVNVITKRQETDGYRTVLSGSYGTWNTTDDYVHHMGKTGIFDYGLFYNFRHTDGHREENVGGTECTSEYTAHNGTLRFGVELGRHFYANVNSYAMAYTMHDPGPDDRSVPAAALEVFDITRRGGSLSVHNAFEKAEGFVQVYYNQGNHEASSPVDGATTFESVDRTYAGKLQETVKLLEGNRLTLGAEYKKYGGEITFPLNRMDEEYYRDLSGYGLVEQNFAKLVTVTAGARYTDNSEYGGFTAYQGGAAVTPAKDSRIYVHAAKGFNIPGIRYRFNKTGPSIDVNANLDPEYSVMYEGGVEQGIIKGLTIGAAVYRVEVENLIEIKFPPPPPAKWVNIDGTIVYYGGEVSLKYTHERLGGVRAAYSCIDHEYEINGQTDVLSFVPKHKAVFGAYLTMFNVYLGLNGEYVHTIYQDYSAGAELDNFLVLNAKIACTFLERFQAFVNLNNITNEEYVAFLRGTNPTPYSGGYPVPGFNFLAGLTVEF
jgi:iron complex outermembrane receptor protein